MREKDRYIHKRLRQMDRFFTGYLSDLGVRGKAEYVSLKSIYSLAVSRRRQHPANPYWFEAVVQTDGTSFKVSWAPNRGELFITPIRDGRVQHAYRFRVAV